MSRNMALLRVFRLQLLDLSYLEYVRKYATSRVMKSACCYFSITSLSKQVHVSLHTAVKKCGAASLSCKLDAVLLFVGYFEDLYLHFAMFNKL